MSSGFSWYIHSVNMENITININNNIGDTSRPEKEDDKVAAYGLTHHYGNVNYSKVGVGSGTWDQLHNQGNPDVLREGGYIKNLTLNVGGNIQAYGHNRGYTAGVGQDMASAWLEELDIKIGGDIVTDLEGNDGPIIYDTAPYAFGISEEVMNITDSSLEVNNIIFRGKNLSESNDNISHVGAFAHDNSKGNYINIKRNTVTVKGKIEGKSSSHILSSVGFYNGWNSNGKNGVNWLQYIEENHFKVGEVDLAIVGDKRRAIQYYGLGEKCRTGAEPLGTFKLPEASAKYNSIEVGDVKISNPNGTNFVALLFYNASNAKGNYGNYGDINIVGNYTNFFGMGTLQNKKPTEIYYPYTAENNHIVMKNVTIDTKGGSEIVLLAGWQDEGNKMDHCSAKADMVDIKVDPNKSMYIGGISSVSYDSIENSRVDLGSINIVNKQDNAIYFGLGSAFKGKNSKIKNSCVFVDKDINIYSKRLFGGGFIGYANTGEIEESHFQIDGKNNVETQGRYGGFAGFLKNSTVKSSSSLILNDFVPFANYADGGTIDGVAHYINGKAPKYYSGLIAGTNSSNQPILKNSTLLVEKEFEDTILYRGEGFDPASINNHLTVVDNENDYNRIAYNIDLVDSTEEEMGSVIKVYKKTGDPIGKVNIVARSFQDKYWNKDIAPYKIGEAENDFAYMNKSSEQELVAFGIDKAFVSEEGKKVSLKDYYHRHIGLRSENGIAYDLLGIKGNLSFKVFYDGNGFDSGSIPVDNKEYKKGDTVTVLDHGNLSRKDYTFTGWNTKKDGSGTSYVKNDTFTINEDITLYAQWKITTPTVIPPFTPPYFDHSKAPILNKEDHFQYLIGYKDHTFRPENNMTREEVTVMFSRLLVDRPIKGKVYSYDYKDIEDSMWSITAVSYMSEKGIVTGYPDGTFRPHNGITRAEFAAIAARFDHLMTGNKEFKDLTKDHWAYDLINKAATAGWITGYPDGTFKPDQLITRAEVVMIVNRMLNRYADKIFVDKNKDKILYFNDIDNTYWAYYPIVEATNGHEYTRDSNGKDEHWKEINDNSFAYDK